MAQGFSQQHGANYDETFSPVVRMESLADCIVGPTWFQVTSC